MPAYRPKGRKNYTVAFQIQGVRFRRGTGQTSKRVADALETQWRQDFAAELAKGGAAQIKKQPISLNEAFGRYWHEVAQYQPTAKDTDAKMDALMGGLTAIEGITKDSPLAAVTDDVLALYVAHRRGQKARRKQTRVSNATVNRGGIEIYRRIYRRARDVWKRAVGETPSWERHLLPEPDQRVRELSADEHDALFAALRPDFHPLFRFCLMTGVRLGNARALTWRQVDLEAGVIRLKIKSRKHQGGREHRVVITAALMVLLQDQRGRHPIYVFTYLCRRSRGRRRKGERYPFSKNGWRKDWKAAIEAAGIEDLRFHDSRHDHGSKLLRSCGNLKLAQRSLGHANIASTMRYVHVLDEDVRQAMERLHATHMPPPAKAETSSD